MIAWILEFVAGLALISLSLAGFAVVGIVFLRWLDGVGVTSFEQLGRSSENQIDHLRDEAIGDMFDVARSVRLQRHVDPEASEDSHEF